MVGVNADNSDPYSLLFHWFSSTHKEEIWTPVLELRGITKRFPGVLANDHIDLKLEEGHVTEPCWARTAPARARDEHPLRAL